MLSETIISAMNELKNEKSWKLLESELRKDLEKLKNKQQTTISKQYSEIVYSENDLDKSIIKLYKDIISKPDELIKLHTTEEVEEKVEKVVPGSKEDFEQNEDIIRKIYE